MSFDMSSPRLVLAGTAYGECRGGGGPGMENVLSVVLTRWQDGWERTPLAVCLAPRQFSCWGDSNRSAILSAAMRDQPSWDLALAAADAALSGSLPRRTGDADSYFALSMSKPAYWARSPARHVFSDRWHSFWRVSREPAHDNETDRLNEAQLRAVTLVHA